jgi:hypothetical protein
MTLTPVQAAHRAAHRARLEVESKRAANSSSDVPRLLAWRAEAREVLATKRETLTMVEDAVFGELIQIVHIQRRLCELGYQGG